MDESLEVAKQVCNSNPNSALLVLCPVFHGGVSQMAIVKKRRIMEDKLLSSLDGWYDDSFHEFKTLQSAIAFEYFDRETVAQVL